MNYVYLGNTLGNKYENTWCPKCSELLIERYGFQIMRYSITPDKKMSPVRGKDSDSG